MSRSLPIYKYMCRTVRSRKSNKWQQHCKNSQGLPTAFCMTVVMRGQTSVQILAFYGKQEKASEWFRYWVHFYYQLSPLFILAAPNSLHFFNCMTEAHSEVVSFPLVSWKVSNTTILIHRHLPIFYKTKGCFQRKNYIISASSLPFPQEYVTIQFFLLLLF